jgi:hypothetical protein
VVYAIGFVNSELEKKMEEFGRCPILIRGTVPFVWRDRGLYGNTGTLSEENGSPC